MLKCILGLLTPEQGDIRIDGQSVIGISSSEREKVNAKIGMLFQNAALFDSLLVWENVAFGLIQGNGMAREQAREIAIQKPGAVGLGPDVGELEPAELSGRMRKRGGTPRAIANAPHDIFF